MSCAGESLELGTKIPSQTLSFCVNSIHWPKISTRNWPALDYMLVVEDTMHINCVVADPEVVVYVLLC